MAVVELAAIRVDRGDGGVLDGDHRDASRTAATIRS
jgi:hypothetical protein